MSDIPSNPLRIQIEGTQTRRPTSESLFQTMGGTTNWLMDENIDRISDIAALTAEVATVNLRGAYALIASASYAVGSHVVASSPGSALVHAFLGGTSSLVPSTFITSSAEGFGFNNVMAPIVLSADTMVVSPLVGTMGGNPKIANGFYFTIGITSVTLTVLSGVVSFGNVGIRMIYNP